MVLICIKGNDGKRKAMAAIEKGREYSVEKVYGGGRKCSIACKLSDSL